MSPQQESRLEPTFADDVYALGCVMVLLLTGLDPRRVLFGSEPNRRRRLSNLTASAPRDISELAERCLSTDPSERPDVAVMASVFVSRAPAFGGGGKVVSVSTRPIVMRDRRRATSRLLVESLIAGQRGLLRHVATDESSGLWLSSAIDDDQHRFVGAGVRSYNAYRSANRGVAGTVYLLGRLARCGHSNQAVRERVGSAAHWLCCDGRASDGGLPGLHFGEAGVAVALVEAISGGLTERTSETDNYVRSALSGDIDWPDVTHGAAGQGIAALYCADRLGDATLIDLARKCADYLAGFQKHDGSWEMPAGVDGLSGQTLTGFAHGVAGVVYFLAEYARRSKSIHAEGAWRAGAEWLMRQAIPEKNGLVLEWCYSDTEKARWKWWCHGSPGIALTFLRLYEQTKNPTYADIAGKALRVHPLDVRYPNLSQCHGLSGLGEIYIEAARVLADNEWYERAERIANVLVDLGDRKDDGSMTWFVEQPNVATADLMVGCSGVIHFLMRFSQGGERMGFPLLLDQIELSECAH